MRSALTQGTGWCLPSSHEHLRCDPKAQEVDFKRNLSFRPTGKTIVPAPPISAIVESCLYSHDLARSIRFYQERLGLRLIESGERLCVFSVADKQVLLIFRSGGTLEPVPMPGGMIPPHEATGQLHFAFAISKENFAAWEKHLIAQGIKIESKVDWPGGGQSLYFRDPDNHLVELATPGIWEVY